MNEAMRQQVGRVTAFLPQAKRLSELTSMRIFFNLFIETYGERLRQAKEKVDVPTLCDSGVARELIFLDNVEVTKKLSNGNELRLQKLFEEALADIAPFCTKCGVDHEPITAYFRERVAILIYGVRHAGDKKPASTQGAGEVIPFSAASNAR